jgi:hypothetical protein
VSWYFFFFNPFPADVANKQLLGRQAKWLFGTKSHKNKPSFTYRNCFINLGCLSCKHRRKAHSMLSKTQKNWLQISSIGQKLLTVSELLTSRWNAWHSERHCIFTTGGEKVKAIFGEISQLFFYKEFSWSGCFFCK